ncbi:hypothetical protein PGB90_001956 [Kerria lacca]
MRNKNIYSQLPVEELPEEDKSAPLQTEKYPSRNKCKSKKPKRSDINKNVEKFKSLSINSDNKVEDNKKNFASIIHKNVTGSNNWESFLEKSKLSSNQTKENDEFFVDETEDENPRRRKNNSCIAIDCEMVGIGEGGKENMLARVSIVNSLGECLYDTFVKPTATVTDYRTPVSGVRPHDIANAEKFTVVQSKVLELINGKILVGHAVYNDLIVLKIRHPRHRIRDTSKFKKFYQIGVGTPSLKKLTSHFLNVNIQCGEHNSIQDAQAAMQLYMLYRKEWEADLKKRKHLQHRYHHSSNKKKSKTSYKPKRFHKNYKK